jgi:hypothetical protein
MAAVRARLVLFFLFALTAWTLLPSAGASCPFCTQDKAPTLVGDFNQAVMVLVGEFTNAKIAEGTSDFVVEKVLKTHEFLKGKKVKTVDGKQVITLPRPIQAKNQFLIFCDVFKDTADPYRGVELMPGNELVPYLTGAIAVKDRPESERLRYCFDHLNSADFEVAMDAYREYAKADYKDYMEMAKKLPPDTIAKWLEDPKTPPFRYGLYASLLGHCGRAMHAQLLREMIDDPEKRKGSGIDGMLAGYTMIDPKEAWGYLTRKLKDQSEDFLMRYAVLRTIRFLWDNRSDLLPKDTLVSGMAMILDHGDMADFAIEDLRKWQRWEMTDRILALFGTKTHDVPVVKRAILRFALSCPRPRAVSFVEAQRRRDPNWVKDTEELLKLETPDPPVEKKK